MAVSTSLDDVYNDAALAIATLVAAAKSGLWADGEEILGLADGSRSPLSHA